MKILYLCTYYHRATIFRDSANELRNLGHDVDILNVVSKGTDIKEEVPFVNHAESFKKSDRYFYNLKQRKIQNTLEKLYDISQYDIIHSHTLFNGGYALYKIKKDNNIKYTVSVRNTDLNFFMRIPFFKRVAERILIESSGILFLSNAYKNHFLNHFKNSKRFLDIEGKSKVVINGLEDFWLQEKGKSKKFNSNSPLRLLSVGKVDKNKNIGTTINALNTLNGIGIETYLTVIGKVRDRRVAKLIESNDKVQHIQFMPKEKLINFYRDADIFVMPSITETFGRVYAESITQGTPVIYSRGQGFDGLFMEGEIGYSVVSNSSNDIVDRVLDIIANYEVISRNCLASVDRFNWRNIGPEIRNFYIESLSRG